MEHQGNLPEIIAETASYLVLYKPPFLHSAPLGGETDTLLGYAARLYPEVLMPRGKKACEGGLLHRLDYETRGLLLIARTQAALDELSRQQEAGLIVKEYEAVSGGIGSVLPGFPPPPDGVLPERGARIRSAFRPWGRGRKAVRPLVENVNDYTVNVYTTEICSVRNENGCVSELLSMKNVNDYNAETEEKRIFRIRLTKGFRHQIRCHLAWIGRPILNDALYGGLMEGGNAAPLALFADYISFIDPESGERREYSP